MDEKYFYRVGIQDGILKAKRAYKTSLIMGFILIDTLLTLFPGNRYAIGAIIIIGLVCSFVIPPIMLTSADSEKE